MTGSRDADVSQDERSRRRWPNVKKRPLDGGWGWMVVLGCAMMHLLVAGLSRSYGVIYVQLQRRYHSNAAITAWVGGTSTAVRMGFSPIATTLSNRFGTRPVIFCGGLLIGLGCLVCAFTPSTEFMFFSYSILVGFGGTLSYAPSLVLVGQYFNKYRAIAVGLGSAGSGVGAFGIPMIMNLLFNYYGYTGTLMLIAGVMFNVCVCAALHRPLEANHPPLMKTPQTSDPEKSSESVRKGEGQMDTIQEQCAGKDKSRSGNICEENIKLNENGKLPDRDIAENDESEIRSGNICEGNIKLNENGKLPDGDIAGNHESEIRSGNIGEEKIKLNENGISGKFPDGDITNHPNSTNQTTDETELESISVDIKDSQMRIEKKGCYAELSKYIDLSLCRNPVFILFILSLAFHTLSYMAGQMLIPAMGESRGHSRTRSVVLLSTLGIVDTCGRVGSGFIFDIPVLRAHRTVMYNVCILVAGLCHLMWAFCSGYVALAAACAVHGLFNGCVVSQRAVILADLLGVEKLSSSFGLTIFAQGCGIMIGPPIAGLIRDYTGDYTGSFIFTFSTAMMGVILFFISSHRRPWSCLKK